MAKRKYSVADLAVSSERRVVYAALETASIQMCSYFWPDRPGGRAQADVAMPNASNLASFFAAQMRHSLRIFHWQL